MHEFQFHKGTIKTLGGALGGGGVLVFQFHKGTIKTSADGVKVAKTGISIP